MDNSSYKEKLGDQGVQDNLNRFVASKVKGVQNIEDLVQITNFIALKKMNLYSENGQFIKWIIKIAYWTIRAWKKKEAQSKIIYNSDLCDSASSELFEEPEKVDFDVSEKYKKAKIEVKEVLKSLPLKSHKIFSLSMEGLKPSEIREKTGYSIFVIYKTKQRVKEKIKDRVESVDFKLKIRNW
jgi:RNA polymerase sigma factor (sigma-70 family)